MSPWHNPPGWVGALRHDPFKGWRQTLPCNIRRDAQMQNAAEMTLYIHLVRMGATLAECWAMHVVAIFADIQDGTV